MLKTPSQPIHRSSLPLLLALLFSSPSMVVWTQQTAIPPSNSASSRPLPSAYDVVSVKPHKEDDSGVTSYWRNTPSGFSAVAQVQQLIRTAYHLVTLDQVSGLPDWAIHEDFDVEAKLDPDNAAAFAKLSAQDQKRQSDLMIRAPLADRFKLKTRQDRKTLLVYNLVVAKSGPKLKEASPSAGNGYSGNIGRVCTLKSDGMEMSALADALSSYVSRLVIDKTNLGGKYELNLSFALSTDFTDSAPSLFTALQEQLGLKLEPAKAPVDVIVIDHIERPSDN